MKIKNNYIATIFMVLHSTIIIAMQPNTTVMRPIDRVFLNACKNNKDIMFAINNGANIFIKDPANDYNGLHYACEHGNIDRIQFFLNACIVIDDLAKSLISEKTKTELSNKLLSLSADAIISAESFCKQAKVLIDLGADVNVCNPLFANFTPLSYACFNCNIKKAQFLLDNGANINHQSKMGPPLYVLFAQSKQLFLPNGLSSNNGSFETQNEITSGRFALMQLLLKKGANVILTGTGNHSVLQTAILGNNSQCAKELIKRPEVLNIVDASGHNALYCVISEYLHDDALQLLQSLLSTGVTPVIDTAGLSLMHAAVLRYVQASKYKKNDLGSDALLMIDELLKAGVSVNDKDKEEGQTPLHYAIELADATMVHKLLEAGAQQISDKNGKTPLQLARNNKKHGSEIAKVFKTSPPSEDKKHNPVITTVAKKSVKKDNSKQKFSKKTRSRGANKKTAKPVQHDPSDIQSEFTQPSITSQKETTELLPEKSTELKIEASSVPVAKNEKVSLVDRLQKKVVKAITGQTVEDISKKSYAQALKPGIAQEIQKNVDAAQKKTSVTYFDDHLAITPLLPPVNQNNPLASINKYSTRVLQKMANPTDYFHNFSPDVEKQLGQYASSEVIGHETVMHRIPAIAQTDRGKGTVFNGEFEIITKKEKITHRFYRPLLLPAPKDNGDNKKPLQ